MRLSTGHTFPCTRHRQFLFCPGDPDITKSPLFFQILIVVRSDRPYSLGTNRLPFRPDRHAELPTPLRCAVSSERHNPDFLPVNRYPQPAQPPLKLVEGLASPARLRTVPHMRRFCLPVLRYFQSFCLCVFLIFRFQIFNVSGLLNDLIHQICNADFI